LKTPQGHPKRKKNVKLKQGLGPGGPHQTARGLQRLCGGFEIYAEPGAEYVAFCQQCVIEPRGRETGAAFTDEVLKEQIRQTVEETLQEGAPKSA